MNNHFQQRRNAAWLPAVLGFVFLSTAALGCSACYGRSDSELAEGMNWGIISMIVVVYLVLFSIIGFFVFIIRRAAAADSVTICEQSAKEFHGNELCSKNSKNF